MKNYITIDGGTTNTRISLICGAKTVDTVRLPVGAGSGIDDREILKNAVRDGIERVLKQNGKKSCDIERILASGMITSEFGLYEIEHITAPAGIEELHSGMREVDLPEVSKIPFVFMCGVKTLGGELFETDIMRGEETELAGLMQESDGKCIYVLPGSHSKIIKTDDSGRIVSFSTMLTGEMTAALSHDTILRDAVNLSVQEFDGSYLKMGCKYAMVHGINEALFKTRILKNIFKCSPEQCYSFFMGAVLSGEVNQIAQTDAERIVIGGRQQLRIAEAELLKAITDKDIVCVPEETVQNAVPAGMIRIYEYKNNI